jgi:hypothetical protein
MIHWDHESAIDYRKAVDYLTLTFPTKTVPTIIEGLHARPIQQFKVKDILRVSKVLLLPRDNTHIKIIQLCIVNEVPLVPLLLVKYDSNLFVVDGYHRLSAVYYYDEDSLVHVKLLELG